MAHDHHPVDLDAAADHLTDAHRLLDDLSHVLDPDRYTRPQPLRPHPRTADAIRLASELVTTIDLIIGALTDGYTIVDVESFNLAFGTSLGAIGGPITVDESFAHYVTAEDAEAFADLAAEILRRSNEPDPTDEVGGAPV